MTNNQTERHLRAAVTELREAVKVVTLNRETMPDASLHYYQGYAGRLHEMVVQLQQQLGDETMTRAKDRRAMLVAEQRGWNPDDGEQQQA